MIHRHAIRVVPALSVAMIGFGLLVLTQRSATSDEPAAKAPAEPQNLRELIDTATDWYKIYPNTDAKEPARPIEVLRWANNVRGSDDGVTVLYVHDGLPLAAACVFPWRKKLYHCLESLSRDKVIGRRDGQPMWEPQAAGVTFADFDKAPVPESTRPLRLRQMKALADRFEAHMTVKKGPEMEREQLRLLPKPLFRYEPVKGDIVDGTVFAFVVGTDPEVLLQIEALKTGDRTRWQYAFARRTYCRLECQLDQKVVWEADQYPGQDDPKQPHYTIGVPLPAEIAAEQSGYETKKK